MTDSTSGSALAEQTPSAEAIPDALAYLLAGGLASFARLADDAAHAPDLATRVVLSRIAAGELANMDRLERHARDLGCPESDFAALVSDFHGQLSEFDDRAVPRDWWERCVKTYIGYGVVMDVQRELVSRVDEATSDVVVDGLADNGHADYVVATMLPVLEAEPQLAARLALWGRRVVGEALGVASRVVTQNPRLAQLAGVAAPGRRADPEDVATFLGRLSAEHTRRMGRLGLTA